MASVLQGFFLVLWKNLVIRRRHWLLTLFEVLVPVLLFLVYALAKGQMPVMVEDITSDAVYFSPDSLAPSHKLRSTVLLYAPNTTFTYAIMQQVQRRIYSKDSMAFDSEKALLDYYLHTKLGSGLKELIHGVVFEGSEVQFRYKIRCSHDIWQTDRLFPIVSFPGPMSSSDRYFHDGFMALQNALDASFMSHVSNSSDQFEVTTQKFPHPPFSLKDSTYGELNGLILPILAVFSFVMLCPGILKRVVEEKESGIRELMKMMGLRGWMLWLGWIVNALLVNVVSITAIVLLMSTSVAGQGSRLLAHTDASLLWVFLLLYCIASIFLCLAISTLFSRPTLATSCGVITWFLTYFIPLGLVESQGYVGLCAKLLTALLPNMAVKWGFDTITNFETRGIGASWGNVWQTPSGSPDDMTVLHVLFCLLTSSALCGLFTWYVDAVMPGNYGIARPWYFPISWLVSHGGKVHSGIDREALGGVESQAHFEKPPADRKVGVEVRNLRKEFSTFCRQSKVALNGVSIDIYAGCITALLGHNGAGKTTLISILTGLFSPSSGSVVVGGHSVVHQLDRVRASLGLCPQHNLMFPDLTVLEHLLFFARLKGRSRAAAQKEAGALLSRLNLADKANKLTHTLSGGMKRKLSLAIALIGDSQVLILDEPTSGMDPEARREIWDLLLSMRGQRTILLTTHFMEEADVLGDRIAIMDHGRLCCYGTSLFLKKEYGTGYSLKLVKESSCKVDDVEGLVRETVPNAELKHDDSSKLNFTLPAEQTAHFPALFDALDARKGELGVCGVSLSITTMEEVFLRVGQDIAEDCIADRGSYHESEKDCNSSNDLTDNKLQGLPLLLQQVKALFVKKALFNYRKWAIFLIKSAIPLGLTFMTVALSTRVPSQVVSEPPLQFALTGYHAREVPFSLSADPNLPRQRLGDAYGRLVGAEPLPPGTSVTAYLLRLGQRNIVNFREKLVVAAEFNSTGRGKVAANGLYSSVLLHAAPLSLNLLDNALLQYLKNQSYSITTINHPFPVEQGVGSDVAAMGVGVMFLWLTLVPLGLLVLVGMFLVFPLDERVSQVKQLQLMANVCAPVYWLVCFFWDLLLYLVVTALLLVVVVTSDQRGIFSNAPELGTLYVLLLLYGLSGIPCAYFFSYLRKTVASGFVLFIVSNMLIGVLMSIVVYVLGESSDPGMKTSAKALRSVLMILPHFSLCHALMQFSMQVVDNHRCQLLGATTVRFMCERSPTSQCCPAGLAVEPLSYLDIASDDNPRGVAVEALYLLFSSALYWTLILLVDYGIVARLYERLMVAVFSPARSSSLMDDDVLKEQERVDGHIKDGHNNGRLTSVVHGNFYKQFCPALQDLNSESSKLYSIPAREDSENDILVVHGLEKRYGGSFTAVKGISFGVGHGDCFGLLGVNGAGKTSTFQMLTGAQMMTRGDAYISAWSLRQDSRKFLSQLGYCPQFDALNTSLTGREMLQLFANLRGVPRDVDHEVNYWIHRLGLEEHADRLCGTYSGGNKRKLSTALALVGAPPVVLLDEPTSGVDPVARRNLWGVLREVQERNQAIVLTSHSMDECEALCRRLAIMVNGQFVCMGDIQYLKSKFGQGFTVMLKLHCGGAEPQVGDVKQSFQAAFPGHCVLKDEHQGLLHYHVTDPHLPWKQLFSVLEALKDAHAVIQDYTISETTLEQVFLAFARAQKDAH